MAQNESEVVLAFGLCTEAQCRAAEALSRDAGMALSEALVTSGAITHESLQNAMQRYNALVVHAPSLAGLIEAVEAAQHTRSHAVERAALCAEAALGEEVARRQSGKDGDTSKVAMIDDPRFAKKG